MFCQKIMAVLFSSEQRTERECQKPALQPEANDDDKKQYSNII